MATQAENRAKNLAPFIANSAISQSEWCEKTGAAPRTFYGYKKMFEEGNSAEKKLPSFRPNLANPDSEIEKLKAKYEKKAIFLENDITLLQINYDALQKKHLALLQDFNAEKMQKENAENDVLSQKEIAEILRKENALLQKETAALQDKNETLLQDFNAEKMQKENAENDAVWYRDEYDSFKERIDNPMYQLVFSIVILCLVLEFMSVISGIWSENPTFFNAAYAIIFSLVVILTGPAFNIFSKNIYVRIGVTVTCIIVQYIFSCNEILRSFKSSTIVETLHNISSFSTDGIAFAFTFSCVTFVATVIYTGINTLKINFKK